MNFFENIIYRLLPLVVSIAMVSCSSDLSKLTTKDLNVGGPAQPGSSTGLHGAIDSLQPGLLLNTKFTLVSNDDGLKDEFTIDAREQVIEGKRKNLESLDESSFIGFENLEALQSSLINSSLSNNSSTSAEIVPDSFWSDFTKAAGELVYVEQDGKSCDLAALESSNIYIDNKQYPSRITIPGSSVCYTLDVKPLREVINAQLKSFF